MFLRRMLLKERMFFFKGGAFLRGACFEGESVLKEKVF